MMDSWQETAEKEVEEETGIKNLTDFHLTFVSNDPMPADNKHYITLFLTCKAPDGVGNFY